MCIDAGNNGPQVRGADLLLNVHLYTFTTFMTVHYDGRCCCLRSAVCLWLKVDGSTGILFTVILFNGNQRDKLKHLMENESYVPEAPFENIMQICTPFGHSFVNNFILVFSEISLITVSHIIQKKRTEDFILSVPKVRIHAISREGRRGDSGVAGRSRTGTKIRLIGHL